MQKLIVTIFFLTSINIYARLPDVKKELNLKIENYVLDEKKSKGDICDNIDKPEWDGDTLRFGPHIFFDHIGGKKIVDKQSDPDCTYEFVTTYKNRSIVKNINQKCKNNKDSSLTVQKVEFKNNEISISYQQNQNKKKIQAHCYLKLAKEQK